MLGRCLRLNFLINKFEYPEFERLGICSMSIIQTGQCCRQVSKWSLQLDCKQLRTHSLTRGVFESKTLTIAHRMQYELGDFNLNSNREFKSNSKPIRANSKLQSSAEVSVPINKNTPFCLHKPKPYQWFAVSEAPNLNFRSVVNLVLAVSPSAVRIAFSSNEHTIWNSDYEIQTENWLPHGGD